MLIPLTSFIVGIALLGFACFVYFGNPIVKSIPGIFNLKGEQSFAWGISCIAIALILGMIGYLGYIDSSLLRTLRIILGLVGLCLMALNFFQTTFSIPTEHITKYTKYIQLEPILTSLSIGILFSIFLISFFDYNYGGDAFMYHVPFAARIWGIVTPEHYIFEHDTENRFLGFPLLASFLQGLFWKVLQKPEATNLVCYSSLIILLAYLKFYLKIPFYLGTLALLAVPMVHMHAARSYVDLPANVGVSILILTTYLFYTNKLQVNNKTLLIVFLSSATAANIKFQLIPVVFLILCFLFPQIISKYQQNNDHTKMGLIQISKTLVLCFAACLIIFSTSFKNIILYQNPFYPVKVEIAGVVLNHNEAPPNFMHENIKKLPPPLRWGKSVLEINTFDSRRPWPWTLGMDFISWEEEKFGMGGYFGGYVIFNLLLFIYLVCKRRDTESKIAIRLMILMTLITSILPQSYELRYYMYWMIVFVSLNCYLTCRLVETSPQKISWLTPRNVALVAMAFMLIFITKTRYFFTRPEFSSFSKQLERTDIINQDLLRSIKDGDQICLVGKAPHAFFYNSSFYPDRNYSIKAEFDMPPDYIAEKCQGRKILR